MPLIPGLKKLVENDPNFPYYYGGVGNFVQKSFAFGDQGFEDRLEGSSNQPYVPVHSNSALQAAGKIGADIANVAVGGLAWVTQLRKPNFTANKPVDLLNDKPYLRGQLSDDFLIRGGIAAPSFALEDVQRLTKYFFDPKSVSGLLFTAKQNILSNMGVRTQASGILNEGAYTPFSTIGQAGVGFIGIHLNKQGIDPTGLIPLLSLKTYEEAILSDEKSNTKRINRLQEKIDKLSAEQDKDNSEKIQTFNDRIAASQSGGGKNRLVDLYTNKQAQKSGKTLRTYTGGPGSIFGIGWTRIKFDDARTGVNSDNYTTDSLRPALFGNITPDVTDQSYFEPITDEFRIYYTATTGYRTPVNVDPTITVESKYNFIDPSDKPDEGGLNDYSTGKVVNGATIDYSDGINALPIYKSKDAITNNLTQDIIPFRIATVDNSLQNASESWYIHFRAFIDDFSDSFDAQWDKVSYMGRGESFYKYGGFSRDISLSFTVAAQSKKELVSIYKKLNFLVSTLTPTYTGAGYMSGNLHKITVGGYLVEQYGIVTSIGLSFDDSPWEIGIDTRGGTDPTTSQVPMTIKVKMNFTPIHNFRPQIQFIDAQEDAQLVDNNNYGNTPYIALKNQDGESLYRTDKALYG